MNSRILQAILCVVFITLFQVMPAAAHDKVMHNSNAAADSSTASEPQIFEAETLRIPDAPVVDSDYYSEGFVSRYRGKGQLLISFTYTGCETLCPVSNAVLQQLDRRLSDMADVPLHIVTLSIDPIRDTPAALQESRKTLNASDNWSWLTAAPQDNRLLLESFGIDPGLLEEHDPMFLLGDLSTGEFVRIIGMPDPDRILRIAQSNIH